MKRYKVYKKSGLEWLKEIPEHWEIIPLKRFVSITDLVIRN